MTTLLRIAALALLALMLVSSCKSTGEQTDASETKAPESGKC